jgi:hypothetical protein
MGTPSFQDSLERTTAADTIAIKSSNPYSRQETP